MRSIVDGMKTCQQCKETKPEEDFYIDKGKGNYKTGTPGPRRLPYCKPCSIAKAKKYRNRWQPSVATEATPVIVTRTQQIPDAKR